MHAIWHPKRMSTRAAQTPTETKLHSVLSNDCLLASSDMPSIASTPRGTWTSSPQPAARKDASSRPTGPATCPRYAPPWRPSRPRRLCLSPRVEPLRAKLERVANLRKALLFALPLYLLKIELVPAD